MLTQAPLRSKAGPVLVGSALRNWQAGLAVPGQIFRLAACGRFLPVPVSARAPSCVDDQLISQGRVVDDLVPRSGQRPSQPAYVFPNRVGGQRLFRFVVEFRLDPIVVDHLTSMSVEESEEPPEVGRQATWLTGDQHEMPSPV